MADSTERFTAALADRYAIERELGSGGMATVYLARDLKHDRPVAIKVLRPEIGAAIGVERFVREIEIAARLTHPHILPLFDSGEADGLLYYVMPYIAGQSLRERLARDGSLPPAEAIRIADQIASALGHAHERGIVHRDIKPENILLAGDQAIVADFGIARAVEAAGGERLTGTGIAIGTPAYMSPEQALGTHEVDARTDVYALGCVVYEMVAGRAPFVGATPQALIARHAVDTVPALRTAEPDVPLFVERAVERALAKSPDDRFPSAASFAQALTSGMVVPSLRRRAWGRHAVRAAAAVALVAAAGWGVATWLAAPDVRRLAVLPLTDLSNDTAQQYLVEGVHEALISELAQLGLSVIARTTMQQYRHTTKPIREIARELGVQAVIEGSLFRAGDSLEIAARLYDGESEREVWTGSYDGDLPNVIALYRGFARAIADEIRLTLTPVAAARLARAPPVDPAVYEAYLRGMHHLNKSTPENFERALVYFHQAVETNPADPLAYAGLAFGYITLGHGPAPPPDAWPRARAAAERAVRLDSTLAEGWAALADIKTYYDWDWEGAEHAFRRANELNPSLAMNRYHYAWFLVLFGRTEEAIAEHERARELDPLTPLFTVWIPGIYFSAGRHEKAFAEARRNIAQYPDNAIALFILGASAAETGRFDDAIAAHEKMARINPFWSFALARTYALAGRSGDAERIVARLEAQPATSWGAINLASLHATLGDIDAAFRWLAYEPPHAWLPWVKNNPAYERLRGDPRFGRLLARMNLGS